MLKLEEIIDKIIEANEYEKFFDNQITVAKKLNEIDFYKNLINKSQTATGKTHGICPFLYTSFLMNKKVIFAVPNTGVIRDKIKDLNNTFSKFKKKPKILKCGDDYAWKNADILIGTFEQIFRGYSYINLFDVCVLDDFHVMYDDSRGILIEKLIMFLLTNKKIKIIALSATINPIELLSKWLGNAEKAVFPDEMRYVDLEHFYIKKEETINKTLLKLSKSLSKKEHTPTLIFCNKKSDTIDRCELFYNIEASPINIMMNGKINTKEELLKEHTKKEINFDEYDRDLLKYMQYGIAFHNSNLDYKTRKWVENCCINGKLKFLCATSGLANGVNLKVQSVIICDFYYWNPNKPKGKNRNEMLVSTYKQMEGRVARPPLKKGYAYIICENDENEKYIMEKYVDGEIEDVESKINNDDFFKKTILDFVTIFDGEYHKILNAFENSLFNMKEPILGFRNEFVLEDVLQEQMDSLIDIECLKRRDAQIFTLTNFGKKCCDFNYKTYKHHNIQDLYSLKNSIEKISNQNKKIKDTDLLKLSLKVSLISGYSPILLTPGTALKDMSSNIQDEADATSYIILKYWIKNIQIKDIENSEGKWATYIESSVLLNGITAYLEFTRDLAIMYNLDIEGDFDALIECIRDGLISNLTKLVKIKKLGRNLTLRVYNDFKNYKNKNIEFERALRKDILEMFKLIPNNELYDKLMNIDQIGIVRTTAIFQAIGKELPKDKNVTFADNKTDETGDFRGEVKKYKLRDIMDERVKKDIKERKGEIDWEKVDI